MEKEKYLLTVIKNGGLGIYDINENKFLKEINDVKGQKITAAFFAKIKNDVIVLVLGFENNSILLLDEEILGNFISEPEKFNSELILKE